MNPALDPGEVETLDPDFDDMRNDELDAIESVHAVSVPVERMPYREPSEWVRAQRAWRKSSLYSARVVFGD